jgi:N-acetylmuramoyl-L-alanine amidase
MMQNAFLDKSLAYAGKVQHQLVDNLKLFDRGVKQAGFLVLYKTAMPGVLIETGFISNAREEKFLLSEKGQDQVAYAIYKALREYKNQIENKPSEPQPEDTLVAANQSSDVFKNANAGNPVSTGAVVEAPDPDAVAFRVQFAIYPDSKPLDSKIFDGIKDVQVYFHSGSYKYTSGNFNDIDAALLLRKEMISKGYKDAFIVAFKGKNRITIDEAKRLTGKK